MTPDILCIGSVLWDVIGRSPSHMRVGSDVPGRINRIPGGVAMNIAMTLKRFGLSPALLTSIGRDAEGDELIREAEKIGLNCDHIYRSEDLPTDVYMAIEGGNGLIAAIADAHSLEAAGEKILSPIADGAVGTDIPIALDGNLTVSLLQSIAQDPMFGSADLRVAPASPGKAERLLALIGHSSATLYVNLEEANLLCQSNHNSSEEAALALVEKGANRVLVTDGGNSASEASTGFVQTLKPPSVLVTRVTGAGDTFMAAHIASEVQGLDKTDALQRALLAAASGCIGRNTPDVACAVAVDAAVAPVGAGARASVGCT